MESAATTIKAMMPIQRVRGVGVRWSKGRVIGYLLLVIGKRKIGDGKTICRMGHIGSTFRRNYAIAFFGSTCGGDFFGRHSMASEMRKNSTAMRNAQ